MQSRINSVLFKTFEMKPIRFLISMYSLAFLWALTLTVFLNAFAEIESQPAPDGDYFWFAVSLLVTAPIIETLLFQYALQNSIRRLTGHLKSAIFISAFLFAFMHIMVAKHIPLYVFGLGLSLGLIYEYVRMRSNNLMAILSVIGFHCFWNAIIGGAVWLAYVMLA